jgi:hypothetical protein
MYAFNRSMTLFFDLLFRPFTGLPPAWGLISISLVTGVILLWIFGKVSNQTAIRVIRDRIRGNLIGVRLFQNDIAVVLRLQAKILRDTLVYMRYSIVPMIILLIPVLLIMTQLNLRFAARPLHAGETTLVTVKLHSDAALREGATLEAPEGIEVETEAVHMPAKGEVVWRIRAVSPGRHDLKIVTPRGSLEKAVIVGWGWTKVPTLRSASRVDQFLFLGEPPIPGGSPFLSARVAHPPLAMTFLGLPLNWIVGFFVFSLVAGFACKGALGVEF